MARRSVIQKVKGVALQRFRRPPSSTPVSDVSGARALALLTGRFHFELPIDRICWTGAFRFGEWHPWVRALSHGRGELERYYERFQPATVGERYLLASDAPGLERPYLDPAPWWRRAQADTAAGLEYNAREAQKYCGPIDPDKLEEEWQRLHSLRRAIEEQGYQPQRHDGHIRGYFLLADGEEVFQISAGQHRLAVLAALGWTTVPVTFQPTFPRTIDLADVEHFPGVRSGDYSVEAASLLFRQHFVLDGSQQYAAADGARP